MPASLVGVEIRAGTAHLGVGHDFGRVMGSDEPAAADNRRAGRQHFDPLGYLDAQLEAEDSGEFDTEIRWSVHAAMGRD